LRLLRLHILSEFRLLHHHFNYGIVLILFGRLNRKLEEKDMRFQDEGGLLLPPTIEQKVSSTGMLIEHDLTPPCSSC
jgi:hypothetical protein